MCSILGYSSKDADYDSIVEAFYKTKYRGPDDSRILKKGEATLMFHRLAIMGLDEKGMQPFEFEDKALVCNGEIYGFRKLKEELIEKGYSFKSDSDCEILIPLYLEKGVAMFKELNAEFAMILYDGKSLIAARDPIGIRPLFYGYLEDGSIIFASEAINLIGIVKEVTAFPPGHYYKDGKFVRYADLTTVETYSTDGMDECLKNIHDKLIEGVRVRLDADAPVGFLLSGGLDSSLVCAISQKFLNKPIKTYAIGMDKDAIDLKYAREAADYIGANHTEVFMTREEVLDTLEEVISILGTYDITTIRASMGMYLCCRKIHEIGEVKVLLTGEISDELFGYKYTDFAPDAESFQSEAKKRVDELYMYDVLRADRCISVNSLEARVPFGDIDFVKYVMAVNPELKVNTYGKGKYLLRHAFEGQQLLPDEILWREKAAFSDAVGHSMVDYLKEYAEKLYSDSEFETLCKKYTHATPFTKESLLYREIFEKYYEGQSQMIVDFWMPNKEWEGCNVNDPSARILSNYGDSGK